MNEVLSSLTSSIAHRARDGHASWVDGDQRIGISLSYTRTASDQPEKARIAETGDVVAAAVVRLDNRDEVIMKLGLDERGFDDTHIIIEAWRRWGTGCVRHLLGDFAFIIYDRSRKQLFAARDHMGVKPLFLRFSGDSVAISSELQALVALNGLDPFLHAPGVSDAVIAAYILDKPFNDHRGLFEGIQRLPPGHIFIRTSDGYSISSYWSLETNKHRMIDVSPEKFREIFDEAVKCRMKPTENVAFALSGGLDSSSIVSSAAITAAGAGLGNISTFSAVHDRAPDLNEREFMQFVVDYHDIKPTFFESPMFSPLTNMREFVCRFGKFFPAPNLQLTLALYDNVEAGRFRVLMDGHGGDEVVSYGMERITELVKEGDWKGVWSNIGGLTDIFGQSRAVLFTLVYLRNIRLRGARRISRLISCLAGISTSGSLDVLSSALRKEVSQENPSSDEPMGPGRHIDTIRHAMQAEYLEIIELFSSHYGIDVRIPFYDVRLVEYCVNLPAEAKLNRGWTRLILREAMGEDLPKEIRWRRTKFDFTRHFSDGLLTENGKELERIIYDDSNPVSAFVDLQAVRVIYQNLKKNRQRPDGREAQLLWRIACLSAWLQHHSRQNT
ncbi:asparagine synthase-related protein [Agrobacterium cavarae]|uniref:asparagine synthase-related protein n=1 Tax=Agrobacterium cavarae TaxID=2528239 RepID=UPI0028AC9CA2|nr:asparagine synthase-related protein [Agrobacterium cavarae]